MRVASSSQDNLGWWVKHGVIGGVLAGVAFAAFEMLMAAWMRGMPAFFMPMRMIGATVLGRGALDPSYSLPVAAVTGAIVHLMFSALFGLIFALIVWLLPVVREVAGPLLLSASVYGLALWAVNFYVIAPGAGWAWFPAQGMLWVQFVAHTFAFGTVLGIYLDAVGARPPQSAALSVPMEPLERQRKAG